MGIYMDNYYLKYIKYKKKYLDLKNKQFGGAAIAATSNNQLHLVIPERTIEITGDMVPDRDNTSVTIPDSVTNLDTTAFDSDVTITRGVSHVTRARGVSDVGESKVDSAIMDLFLESITIVNGLKNMNVSRGNVFNSLKNYGSSVFYKGKWSIKFNDEAGIDQGGVRRDFFTELAKELVDQNYFTKDSTGFHLINQKSSEDTNIINDYEFIGKLFAYVVKSHKSEYPNNINLKLHPYLLNALLNSKYGEKSHDLTKTYGHNLFDLLDASDINILDKIPYIHQFISKELKYSDRKVSNTNNSVDLLEMISQYNHNLLEEQPISS